MINNAKCYEYRNKMCINFTPNTISNYKASLVVKVFNQRPNLDYSEKFNPAIKLVTVRLVLCITLTNGWPCHQLDLNNTFIQGEL